MRRKRDDEARAIARLIAEINSIEALRDRVGRWIVALFFGVFVVAISLLAYVATHPGERVNPPGAGKPAPAVMHSFR